MTGYRLKSTFATARRVPAVTREIQGVLDDDWRLDHKLNNSSTKFEMTAAATHASTEIKIPRLQGSRSGKDSWREAGDRSECDWPADRCGADSTPAKGPLALARRLWVRGCQEVRFSPEGETLWRSGRQPEKTRRGPLPPRAESPAAAPRGSGGLLAFNFSTHSLMSL